MQNGGVAYTRYNLNLYMFICSLDPSFPLSPRGKAAKLCLLVSSIRELLHHGRRAGEGERPKYEWSAEKQI